MARHRQRRSGGARAAAAAAAAGARRPWACSPELERSTDYSLLPQQLRPESLPEPQLWNWRPRPSVGRIARTLAALLARRVRWSPSQHDVQLIAGAGGLDGMRLMQHGLVRRCSGRRCCVVLRPGMLVRLHCKGYAEIHVGRGVERTVWVRAHMVACWIAHGPQPAAASRTRTARQQRRRQQQRRPHCMHDDHRCLSKACISPFCLSWGTAEDNGRSGAATWQANSRLRRRR